MSNTENKNLQKEQILDKQIEKEAAKTMNQPVPSGDAGIQNTDSSGAGVPAPKKNDTEDKNPRSRRERPQGGRRFERPRSDMVEKVIKINRVVKVVKGGRNFRFTSLVVVGDKKGKVGFYNGKATEIPAAIKKAFKKANKNTIQVPIFKGCTIPHVVKAKYGASIILLKPAKAGTGIIAGGTARSVLELAGITDAYAKSLGSNNPINVVAATIKALSKLMTIEERNSKIISKEERAEMAEARIQKRLKNEVK